jgi:hypothetical protein
MDEQQAKDLCERLAREHPDRETHRWVATKRDEEWVVAKIGLPPASQTTPEVRAESRPATPEPPDTGKPWLNPPGSGMP